MAEHNPHGLMTRARTHVVSRLSAWWLVVLIVLPFTAPFATYDLSHGTHHDELFKDKIDSDALIVVPANTAMWAPSLLRTPARRPGRPALIPLLTSHTVLRL